MRVVSVRPGWSSALTLARATRNATRKDSVVTPGSKATLLRKRSDPYAKVICYANDRIGDSSIVCFVTEKAFDGM